MKKFLLIAILLLLPVSTNAGSKYDNPNWGTLNYFPSTRKYISNPDCFMMEQRMRQLEIQRMFDKAEQEDFEFEMRMRQLRDERW